MRHVWCVGSLERVVFIFVSSGEVKSILDAIWIKIGWPDIGHDVTSCVNTNLAVRNFLAGLAQPHSLTSVDGCYGFR